MLAESGWELLRGSQPRLRGAVTWDRLGRTAGGEHTGVLLPLCYRTSSDKFRVRSVTGLRKRDRVRHFARYRPCGVIDRSRNERRRAGEAGAGLFLAGLREPGAPRSMDGLRRTGGERACETGDVAARVTGRGRPRGLRARGGERPRRTAVQRQGSIVRRPRVCAVAPRATAMGPKRTDPACGRAGQLSPVPPSATLPVD